LSGERGLQACVVRLQSDPGAKTALQQDKEEVGAETQFQSHESKNKPVSSNVMASSVLLKPAAVDTAKEAIKVEDKKVEAKQMMQGAILSSDFFY
jgi:hypothetical protein